jgi:hypothetical protein
MGGLLDQESVVIVGIKARVQLVAASIRFRRSLCLAGFEHPAHDLNLIGVKDFAGVVHLHPLGGMRASEM